MTIPFLVVILVNPEKLASIIFSVFVIGSIFASIKFSVLRKSKNEYTYSISKILFHSIQTAMHVLKVTVYTEVVVHTED